MDTVSLSLVQASCTRGWSGAARGKLPPSAMKPFTSPEIIFSQAMTVDRPSWRGGSKA